MYLTLIAITGVLLMVCSMASMIVTYFQPINGYSKFNAITSIVGTLGGFMLSCIGLV